MKKWTRLIQRIYINAHHLLLPIFSLLLVLWSLFLEKPPDAPHTEGDGQTDQNWKKENDIIIAQFFTTAVSLWIQCKYITICIKNALKKQRLAVFEIMSQKRGARLVQTNLYCKTKYFLCWLFGLGKLNPKSSFIQSFNKFDRFYFGTPFPPLK